MSCLCQKFSARKKPRGCGDKADFVGDCHFPPPVLFDNLVGEGLREKAQMHQIIEDLFEMFPSHYKVCDYSTSGPNN